MMCFDCGSAEGMESLEDYPYKEAGLPNVTLEGVSVWTCAQCKEQVVRIPNIVHLHKSIAREILRKKSWTKEEARFIRSVAEIGEGDVEPSSIRLLFRPTKLDS